MTAVQALLTSCSGTLVACKATCVPAVQVSQRHADAYCQQLSYKKANMRFVEGHIEYLDKAGIADKSFDLVISNCVVNLSPDKKRVLQEAYRVLANGGEFYFSDVYCDRRLPQYVKDHEVDIGVPCMLQHAHHCTHHATTAAPLYGHAVMS